MFPRRSEETEQTHLVHTYSSRKACDGHVADHICSNYTMLSSVGQCNTKWSVILFTINLISEIKKPFINKEEQAADEYAVHAATICSCTCFENYKRLTSEVTLNSQLPDPLLIFLQLHDHYFFQPTKCNRSSCKNLFSIYFEQVSIIIFNSHDWQNPCVAAIFAQHMFLIHVGLKWVCWWVRPLCGTTRAFPLIRSNIWLSHWLTLLKQISLPELLGIHMGCWGIANICPKMQFVATLPSFCFCITLPCSGKTCCCCCCTISGQR